MKASHPILAIALLCTPAVVAAEDEKQTDDEMQREQTGRRGDQPMPDQQKAKKLSKAELQVTADFHHMNAKEIKLGQMAQKKAQRQQVKDYAKELVEDHRANDKQLVDLAKDMNQSIPKPDKQMTRQAKQTADRLQKLEGEAFEREFLRTMVEDHDRALTKIDEARDKVENEQLTTYLEASRPVIQAHRDRARELQQREPQARAEEVPADEPMPDEEPEQPVQTDDTGT